MVCKDLKCPLRLVFKAREGEWVVIKIQNDFSDSRLKRGREKGGDVPVMW